MKQVNMPNHNLVGELLLSALCGGVGILKALLASAGQLRSQNIWSENFEHCFGFLILTL
jgi:hypothetical protein